MGLNRKIFRVPLIVSFSVYNNKVWIISTYINVEILENNEKTHLEDSPHDLLN